MKIDINQVIIAICEGTSEVILNNLDTYESMSGIDAARDIAVKLKEIGEEMKSDKIHG